MARRRNNVQLRPKRPHPVCEDCGGEIWWAWGIDGKIWTPLLPVRYPLESSEGTYETWRDQHGGLLCSYRAPGTRGLQEQSWRAAHHNVACGRWRFEAARALAREVTDAVPALNQAQLHELDRALAAMRVQIAARAEQLEAIQEGTDS